MSVKPRLTSSMALTRELVICACESDWTQVDAGCDTSDASVTNYYKRGNRSAYFGISASSNQGIQAYTATDVAAIDLRAYPTAVGYTHIKYWIRVTVPTGEGDLRIGLSNAADTSGTEYYVNVPAITTVGTWHRIITPLSDEMIANLNSVDSVHLWLDNNDWLGSVYLDDIRVCKYETAGALLISPAEISTVGNTNASTSDNAEVWVFPYMSEQITVYEVPFDVTVTGYLGSISSWSTSDVQQGRVYLRDGQTAADLQREWTSCALCFGDAELSINDIVAIEISRGG